MKVWYFCYKHTNMDANNALWQLVLTELAETNNAALTGVAFVAQWLLQNNPLDLVVKEPEPDVYVNNYFEQVVPHYSTSTYKSHFRMGRNTMAVLIDELQPILFSEDVDLDKMIVPLAKKVHVTLWMLANYAVTFRECSTLFGLSTGTVHFIMMQICTAICELQGRYLKWPTADQCFEIADDIYERTNFPGVIGALDGCHIEIKAPFHNAYDYYNRKQFHSIILQGTCTPDLRFTDMFVGMPGRVHDARVFRLSPLCQKIAQGLIPEDMHILADSAYSLHDNVLTPFRDNGHLSQVQKKYNTKHASVRSCIERAFGLLKNKFRRLRFLDMSLINEIPVVITACCVLHNFILAHEGYEEGEDMYDDLDEVPELEGNREHAFTGGCIKRNNIASML